MKYDLSYRNKKRTENDSNCKLNSIETLEKYGLKVEDNWQAEIRGIMGESSPCYTFSCKWKRGVGFPEKVLIAFLSFCCNFK